MSNKKSAILSPEEGRQFFRLFIPLLDYVNQKYDIISDLREQLRRGHPDYRDLKEVANELWADPSVIENYIDDCWAEYELTEDD